VDQMQKACTVNPNPSVHDSWHQCSIASWSDENVESYEELMERYTADNRPTCGADSCGLVKTNLIELLGEGDTLLRVHASCGCDPQCVHREDCCADYSAAACPNECDLSSLLVVSSNPYGIYYGNQDVENAPQWLNTDDIWTVRADIPKASFDLKHVEEIAIYDVQVDPVLASQGLGPLSYGKVSIVASMYGQLKNVGQSLPNVAVEFAMSTQDKDEHGKIKKLIKAHVEKIAPYASRTNKQTLLQFQDIKFNTVYRVTVKPSLKSKLRKGKKVKCASMDGLVRFTPRIYDV